MEKLFHRPLLRYAAKVLAAAAVGLAGGYLYYRLVGCANGTCAIASDPVNSTLYGGVIGLILGFGFVSFPKKTVKNGSALTEGDS